MLTNQQLQNALEDALARIVALETKIETMRANINSNFNGHTDILKHLKEFTNCPTPMYFNHIDVAET